MSRSRVKIFTACAAVVSALSLLAGAGEAGKMRKKALVVMLDGYRADVVENAAAPNLRMLMDGKWQQGYKCAWSLTANTILDAPTISGPTFYAVTRDRYGSVRFYQGGQDGWLYWLSENAKEMDAATPNKVFVMALGRRVWYNSRVSNSNHTTLGQDNERPESCIQDNRG